VLKIVATTKNEIEASLVMGRLTEAGIPCMRKGGGARGSLASGGSILVEEADLNRARDTLNADDGGFDEGELARLSQEAGPNLGKQQLPPQPIPADDRDGVNTNRQAPTESDKHHMLRTFGRRAKGENPFGC
jgi:hypothetical protein